MTISKKRKLLFGMLALLALMEISGPASAAGLGPNPIVDCTRSKWFAINTPITGTNIPGDLLIFAVAVTIFVITAIGIIYMLGFGFGIEKLTTFAKSEFFEASMNILVILLIGGGIAFFDPAMSFLGNVVCSTTTACSSGITVSGAPQLFRQICSNIQDNVVAASIQNWAGVFLSLFSEEILTSFSLATAPGGFGVGIIPLYGYTGLREIYWLEQASYLAGMEFGIFVIVTLIIIYNIFPLFLYLGLALRAFPWTRAAGGSMLALFIAFYIVFPAIIYPFTQFKPQAFICGAGSAPVVGSSPLCAGSSGGGPGTFLTSQSLELLVLPLTEPLGTTMYNNVQAFISGFSVVGLDLVGFMIALLISYDMLEYLADIIGAPTMEGRRILSRIV